jgi:hypothetical protein
VSLKFFFFGIIFRAFLVSFLERRSRASSSSSFILSPLTLITASLCSSLKIKQHSTDYAFGDLKFGGNAQALSKKRWLHHTSLLWSFDENRMRRMLKQPARAPEYRGGREHGSFLTSLEAQNELAKRRGGGGRGGMGGSGERNGNSFFESRRHFVEALPQSVASIGGFQLVPTTLEEAEGMVEGVEHHRSTVVIDEE